MKHPTLRLLAPWIGAALLLSISGCYDRVAPVTAPATGTLDTSPDVPVPAALANEIALLEGIAGAPDGGLAKMSEHGKRVVVPAGSIDALAAALATAGRNGTVILKAGTHTESGTVLITKTIALVGEHGAVLRSTTAPYTTDPLLVPALHVKNADRVTIWGVEFTPTGSIGGAGILVENSGHVLIGRNSFLDYQSSVVLHHGDEAMIWKNRVAASPRWTTGEIPESDGIVCMNGTGVRVVDNEVSGGVFGVFASDRGGFSLNNRLHDNLIGQILCCVPENGFRLPSGELVGSDIPGTHWLTRGNDASNNMSLGFLVIDRANNNLLVRNTASNNGAYDIELTTDTYRFGFLTPAAFENTVIAGKSDMRIKNCGINNTIIGGILVDTSLDPCN